jgi:NADH-quinone oxidoreductase subunit M
MWDVLADWILTIVIFAPLVGVLPIAMMSPRSHDTIRKAAILASCVALSCAVMATLLFCSPLHQDGGAPGVWHDGDFALAMKAEWLVLPFVNLSYHVAVDGISIWLVVLTALLTPLAIWASTSGIRERIKEYYILMLLLETGMLGVFCARDLLLFYVFFEFTLVPLYFIIGIWGGPERRRAATKFFIYTMAGSVLTFAAILYLAYCAYLAPSSSGQFTFDLDTLYKVGTALTPRTQRILFLALAAGFAIKVPLFPFHTWLPLAHTEAPTAGSVLLAGVLLKLGTYGFLRFSLPMLPDAALRLAPIVAGFAIVGIIYGALAAWVQADVKKLVAYSSVSHLGFCILGMFSMKMAGLTGSVIYMINHGLSTGALFLVVGMIYERYHTRRFDEIGGLARRMPWLAFYLVFFTLSSIGLPGLNGFIGEFLVLIGTFSSQSSLDGFHVGPLGKPYAVLAATGIVLGAVYMLYMCQRVLFGPVREPAGTPDTSHGLTADLTGREIAILAPIAILCLVIGVWPKPMIATMQPSLEKQVLARVLPTDMPSPALPFAAAGPSAEPDTANQYASASNTSGNAAEPSLAGPPRAVPTSRNPEPRGPRPRVRPERPGKQPR